MDFKSVGDRTLEAFRAWGEDDGPEGGAAASNLPAWRLAEENHEGWRFEWTCRDVEAATADGRGGEGWLLMRASLHDPILVLNVESDAEGETEGVVAAVRAFLAGLGEPIET